MKAPLNRLVILALFISVGVVLGIILLSIPNVEMVTATIFITGYLMGWKEGALAGLLTEGLFSLLNPYGPAAPPLFAAQVFSMSLTGLTGGLIRSRIGFRSLKSHIAFLLCGFFCTLFFSISTTLAFVLFMGLKGQTFWGSVLSGLGFYILHMVSNSIIFLFIVPSVLKAAARTGWFPMPSGTEVAV